MEAQLSPRSTFLLAIWSGCALGIGFVVSGAWWVGLAGVVGVLTFSTMSPSFGVAALGGFVAWTIKSLLTLLWFFTVEPFSWLPAEYSVPSAMTIGIFWLYVGVLLGMSGSGVSVATKFVGQNIRAGSMLVIFPVVWVMGEVLSSFLFSVGTYGAGGALGTSFSFGYIGYLYAEHEVLANVARLGGVYGLTMVVALIAVWVWFFGLLRPRRDKVAIVVGVLFLSLVTAQMPYQKPKEIAAPTVTVAVVGTDFSAQMMRTEDGAHYRAAALQEAVRAALAYEPDYIVLPEDARFTPGGGSAPLQYEQFRLLYNDPKTVLVDSRIETIANRDRVLRAYVLDGLTREGLAVDKQTLVPVGEYVPYVTNLATKLLAPGLTESFTAALVYRPGPLTSQRQFGAEVPAILFCFESANPLAVWNLARERKVPFVAHPISHAMFSQPTELWQQLNRMLIVQARFGQVAVVSAGNKAPSLLYLPNGTTREPEWVTEGVGWHVGLFEW